MSPKGNKFQHRQVRLVQKSPLPFVGRARAAELCCPAARASPLVDMCWYRRWNASARSLASKPVTGKNGKSLYCSMEEMARSHPVGAGGVGLLMAAPEPHGCNASGAVAVFTVEALRRFCDFALATFTEEYWLSQYRYRWKQTGIVSDMTTLYLFYREHPERVVNLAEERSGAVFDIKFAYSSNYCQDEYQLRNGVKRVEFCRGRPIVFRQDGCPVRALALHFQGENKLHIPRYYRGPTFRGKTMSDLNAYLLRTPRFKRRIRAVLPRGALQWARRAMGGQA
jgi:hypothetical protein